MEPLELALLLAAAIGAGAINALAGGGSILTFPALIAVGIPPLSANITNTVALCPGYVGGVIGQWSDLRGQRRRLLALMPLAALGGLAGGLLLLGTGERTFERLIPLLVVGASLLLAAQDRIRALLARRGRILSAWSAGALLFAAALYGGYFGAGVSVMFLAVLGLALNDTLTRLNALKQALSLATNLAAALLFAGSGEIVWLAALVMALGTLAGGMAGGRLASRIEPAMLRRLVVAAGLVIALLFAVRSWLGDP